MADRGRELRHLGTPLRGGVFSLLKTAATALLFCAFICAAFPGCTSSTPQKAVSSFLARLISGDREGAAETTLEGDLEEYPGNEAMLAEAGGSFQVEEVTSDGDRAVVYVRFNLGEESVVLPYVCRLQGSRWKVSLDETVEAWREETAPSTEEREKGEASESIFRADESTATLRSKRGT